MIHFHLTSNKEGCWAVGRGRMKRHLLILGDQHYYIKVMKKQTKYLTRTIANSTRIRMTNFYKATYLNETKQKKHSQCTQLCLLFLTNKRDVTIHRVHCSTIHYTQKTSLFYSLFQAPAEVFLHDGIVPIPLGHASLCYADIIL